MASDVLIFNWIINHFYSICGFQGTYLMYVRSTKLEKTSLSFTNGLALNSSVALRLILIKLLSANGDGEIRTLDPLLARQVLSQLSYTPIWSGTHLLSHTVSSIVPSAAYVLTIVFGIGTGVSPKRISTRKVLSSILVSLDLKTKQYIKPLLLLH